MICRANLCIQNSNLAISLKNGLSQELDWTPNISHRPAANVIIFFVANLGGS